MTYQEYVVQLKTKARDLRRAKATRRQMDSLAENEAALMNLQKELDKADLPVKRLEYQLSQLDEKDPDFAEKKENLEENLEYAVKTERTVRRELEEDIRTLKEAIAEIKETIAKIESGETKMNAEEIANTVTEWLNSARPDGVLVLPEFDGSENGDAITTTESVKA